MLYFLFMQINKHQMHGLYYNYTLKKINEMPLYDAVKQVEFY